MPFFSNEDFYGYDSYFEDLSDWRQEEELQNYYQDQQPTTFQFPGCRNCGDYHNHVADENDGDYVVLCENGKWEEVFQMLIGRTIYFLCKKCNTDEVKEKIEKEDLIRDIIE